jgi:hypothetical protein
MPLEELISYDDARLAVMTDPSVRTWVKSALKDLEARDPVDAADDADLVAKLMALRSTEALNRWRNGGGCYSGIQLEGGTADEDHK